jgi:hypothetical protein
MSEERKNAEVGSRSFDPPAEALPTDPGRTVAQTRELSRAILPLAGLQRRMASFSLTALAIALPALSGARGLAGPPRASERAIVRLAMADERGQAPTTFWWRHWAPESLIASSAAAQAPDDAAEPDVTPERGQVQDAAIDRALPSMRRGSLVMLLMISALVFAACALTRGRVAAISACITLAFLPPVAVEGHFVRAEPVGTVFALLALVVLLGLPPHMRQRGKPLVALGFGLTTAMLTALAIAAVPFDRSVFALPVAALLGAVVPLVLRWGRPVVRGRYLTPPTGPGFARRLWPWIVPSAAALPLSFWTLSVAGDFAQRLRAMPSSVYAVPTGWTAFAVTTALMAFGGSFLAIRVLHDALRQRRTTRAVVFVAFVAPLLVQGVRGEPGIDRLSSAVAVAMVCGFGVAAALWLVIPALLARAGARL